MARRSTPPKGPDWPPEKTLSLLREQLLRLQEFKGKTFREVDRPVDEWEQFTRSVIIHGFGEGSQTLSNFNMARSAGVHNILGIYDDQKQENFEEKTSLFESTLNNSIRELEAALSGSATSTPRNDQQFARLAIEEARKSVPEDDRVHPRVGVVVVKDGRILATAHRGEIPQCHAEYIAMEKKLTDVSLLGATVYTTLEPCTARKHPKVPCAIRLTERKVTRVVIGMLDPDDRISGRGQRTLRKAGIATELFPHELMAEVEELNRDFVRDREARESHLRDAPERGEGLAAFVKPTAPPKVRVALKQGHVSNFLIEYTNDEDEPIFIREARLFGGKDGKIELTEPLTPDDPSTWRVAPRSSMTFGRTIVHQRNPAASLVKMNLNKGIFFETEMDVVVSCDMRGQLFEVRQTLYVKVDGTSNEIRPLV